MIKFWIQWLMFHVKLNMADGEGGGDGEGDGDGDGDGDGGTAKRPDFVPEKFWDPDKGEIRAEAAFGSYTELEKKISTAGQEAVEAFKTEQFKERPAEASSYEVKLPEGILPEGAQFKMDESDPLLGWFKQFAFDQGLSQEMFSTAVGEYVKADLARGAMMKGQIDELGENGQERVDRIDMFLQRLLPNEDEYVALAEVINSPKAVMALEKIIDKRNEPDLFKGGDGGDGEGITREDLKEMMKDTRYWKTKDPEFIKKVQGHYAKLYPGSHQGQGKAA